MASLCGTEPAQFSTVLNGTLLVSLSFLDSDFIYYLYLGFTLPKPRNIKCIKLYKHIAIEGGKDENTVLIK